MAKISDIFKLNKTQHELDFVNIDVDKDFPVFLNPFVFSARHDNISIESNKTIRSFFQYNLDLIKTGQVASARNNFRHLNEVNETCLGMSKGKPRGKGVGAENSEEIFDSILSSEAVKTGIVDDLEDTAIFIEGIGRDKVSDMTTNIVRKILLEYTISQCLLHKIPLTKDVPSGFFWNISNNKWDQVYTDRLIINGKKILLVPKGVVSYVKEFSYQQFHQHHALEFLQEDHLVRNTHLVKHRYDKKGNLVKKFVTKESLIEEELPQEKKYLTEFTKKYPKVFSDFKIKTKKLIKSIENEDFEEVDIDQLCDFLINKLKSIPSGSDNASKYHDLMIGILDLIFYPILINPRKETPLNEGRKRIDITFDNAGPQNGFLYRLQHVHQIPCPFITIECKNYTDDIKNPELDQMVGRLSPNRGKLGFIFCRSLDDEALFMKRCSDSFYQDHGLILPITDLDVIRILKSGIKLSEEMELIMSEKINKIINK